MECNPQRNGGVSPMLKFTACPDILQYAGFTPLSSLTLRNASIGFMQQDGPRFRTPCETASLHGAAMMVSRQALQDAGPMTEIYFLFTKSWTGLHSLGKPVTAYGTNLLP